ncbi:Glyoxalase-like domain-containing protein [Rhodospirillales bacterium URHD0017]|nr:Glyoxalase-like domain-containing protein [Rhodospirillales bacterium URHD0017]
MIVPEASLDHLTVAALTIDEGIAHVRRALGVTVPPGGSHPLMGTHNHLMQLGDGVFLEVIAPDPMIMPQRTRWFGLDDPRMRERLAASPRLISWVVRVASIEYMLAAVGKESGEAVRVTRGSLSWLISVPRDGSMPFDGAFPTLIEWPAGLHPSSRMADLGCRLERLAIAHPKGARLSAALASVVDSRCITISTGSVPQIRAMIRTPQGLRELT